MLPISQHFRCTRCGTYNCVENRTCWRCGRSPVLSCGCARDTSFICAEHAPLTQFAHDVAADLAQVLA